MRLQTIGNIIMFVILYIGVFFVLVKLGFYVAFVGAVIATRWVLKELK